MLGEYKKFREGNKKMEFKICENTIENFHIELWTNGNENSFQRITIDNTETGVTIDSNIIAPVDVFKVATAILCNDKIGGLLLDVMDIWNENKLTEMINELSVNGE